MRPTSRARPVALLLVLALSACKEEPETGVYSGCDPLDPSLCALPHPSSYFLEEADSPTGHRVHYGPESLPENRDDVIIGPDRFNEKDGFSTTASMLVFFEDVSLEGVLGHADLGAYLDEGVKTVLVDTQTGERIPHFVELDMTADDPAERLLLIRPVVALEHARRYVVGIRGLVRNGGGAVEVSEAFAALRDGVETEDWDVEGRRDHFDADVFPALEAQGFERESLQLAWDFVTVSRENSIGRVEWIRDDALQRMGPDGPPFTITSSTDGDCAGGDAIGRTIVGKMTVPLYTQTDEPLALLTRDEEGMPYYNGDRQAEFLVRIPCSLAEDPEPAFLLQYGHGLLGSKEEAKTGWLSAFANERRWVVFATDWTGMSEDDAAYITMMVVSDPTGFAGIPERSVQGFVEALGALRMMRGAMANDDAVKFGGISVIDPDRFGYYGISQGGILGGAYVALSPDLERAVFGVGGAPYEMLLSRSHDFDPFMSVFQEKFTDQRDITLIIGLMQMQWDPGEGAGWLYAMNRDTPQGIPKKDVLLQVAVGDAQVTTLGAHFAARAWGASTVAPQTRPIWGIAERTAPFEGSAIVEWAYSDVPAEPVENLPPDDSHDPHECPRREPMGQQQVFDFLETGTVQQHCTGTCGGVQEDTCG